MKRLIAPLLVVVILFSCSIGTGHQARVPQERNILFIMVDDYGYNDMSFRNNTFYETPNIDALASNSMVFSNGYATCQVCSPSRASVMTGKFPARHGITDWIGAPAGEDWRLANRFNKLLPADYVHELPKGYITLPEALKSEGYKTFFAGKWHLGSIGSWPEDHGFDINKGGWDSGSPKGGYYSPFENPRLENHKDGENLSMRLAEETVQFMKEYKNEKFFAFLSFYAVHGPIQTTQKKWEKYRSKAEQNGIAETAFEMGTYLPIRKTQDNPIYAGLVESMDDAVGIVLASLKELGLDENTIVVFTSDNGGVVAGDSYSTSNLPLRAGKGYQYEGGIREPYFIKVPWLQHKNQVCATAVTGTDFYPTLLELVGAKLRPAEHIDGVSLVPLLDGGQISDRPLIWHYPHYGNQGGEPSSIIRYGDWKLIHYYEDGRDELYDLKTDLGEVSDASVENMEVVINLKRVLFDYLKNAGARFPIPDPLYDKDKEQEYLRKVAGEGVQKQEEIRMKYLSNDFDPKNNWWGSAID